MPAPFNPWDPSTSQSTSPFGAPSAWGSAPDGGKMTWDQALALANQHATANTQYGHALDDTAINGLLAKFGNGKRGEDVSLAGLQPALDFIDQYRGGRADFSPVWGANAPQPFPMPSIGSDPIPPPGAGAPTLAPPGIGIDPAGGGPSTPSPFAPAPNPSIGSDPIGQSPNAQTLTWEQAVARANQVASANPAIGRNLNDGDITALLQHFGGQRGGTTTAANLQQYLDYVQQYRGGPMPATVTGSPPDPTAAPRVPPASLYL